MPGVGGIHIGLGGGGGAGLPIPMNVSGLVAWYDAAKGITKDGSNLVSAWADQSGAGNHLASSVGSEQPLWVASNIGGLPGVRFDGVDDMMKVAFGATKAQPLTWFFVVRNIAAGSNPTESILVDSVAGTARNVTSYFVTGTRYSYFAGASVVDVKTWAYGTAEAFAVQFNGASSYFWEGTTKGSATNPSTQGSDGITLGRRFAQFSSNWYAANADIGEVLLYEGAVSDANCTALLTYLKSKWGV